jgi:hypothetical protein
MDQALRLPASIAVPQHLNKPPKRNPAPYAHNQRTRFHISQLKDANQLKQAVGRDAQQVLNQLHHLVRQNHDLKQQVTSIREDWTQARKDYSSKREHYENLCAINTAKQVILWKFVARLQGGEFEGGGLKDAKERYESREPGVDGAVESPSGARLENGSQGTIASCLSAMSDLALGSPEQSMTGSTATSLDPNAVCISPLFPSSTNKSRRKYSPHDSQALPSITKSPPTHQPTSTFPRTQTHFRILFSSPGLAHCQCVFVASVPSH